MQQNYTNKYLKCVSAIHTCYRELNADQQSSFSPRRVHLSILKICYAGHSLTNNLCQGDNKSMTSNFVSPDSYVLFTDILFCVLCCMYVISFAYVRNACFSMWIYYHSLNSICLPLSYLRLPIQYTGNLSIITWKIYYIYVTLPGNYSISQLMCIVILIQVLDLYLVSNVDVLIKLNLSLFSLAFKLY